MTQWSNTIAKLTIPTPYLVGDVNVYLIKGDRLTLVDVGPKTDEAWHALTHQLKELHIKPTDIEQVILTHHHPDHAGLLDYFPDSLEVYGHWVNDRWIHPTEEFIHENEIFFKKSFLEFGIPKEYLKFLGSLGKELRYSCNRLLTGYLNEGEQPLGLSDWSVFETPGHAQSHIGLYREQDGRFIAGDHLLAHITPNPLLEPPLPGESERPQPQLQYNHSLRKILQVPMSVVYTGHGEDILNKNEVIQKQMIRQHERAQKVKSWLQDKVLTVFEICQMLFPKIYQRQLSLTISETVAQLDYLLDCNEIFVQNDNGLLRYGAKK